MRQILTIITTNRGHFAGFVILVMCLLAQIGFGVYALVTGKSLEPIGDIKGMLGDVVLLLIGYFWGSSRVNKNNNQSQG